MRPSVAGARRLMVRSRVDLPAPERPITPMKAPGATEKEALSTAAFAPKRHVKPSTTNIRRSSPLALRPPLALVFYSFVTARCAAEALHIPLPITIPRYPNVILASRSMRKTSQLNLLHVEFQNGRQSAFDRTDHRSYGESSRGEARRLLRSRCAHDAARCRDGRLLLRRQ